MLEGGVGLAQHPDDRRAPAVVVGGEYPQPAQVRARRAGQRRAAGAAAGSVAAAHVRHPQLGQLAAAERAGVAQQQQRGVPQRGHPRVQGARAGVQVGDHSEHVLKDQRRGLARRARAHLCVVGLSIPVIVWRTSSGDPGCGYPASAWRRLIAATQRNVATARRPAPHARCGWRR
ncbi:hypothetical protein IU459_23235 [Nocardia amamiensis]|uniref:Uncharacterized protein n=1 Tax=Nocardia amamiensis TaxID=404578 RepID=A0ABS0CV15_9NOCA|nr:hypothetical protein [Nocardia amamiensis]MBF6300436.1 hypothetical protein [Nocardia amamiensis]